LLDIEPQIRHIFVMKGWKHIALAILLFVSAGLLFRQMLQLREPKYEGRSLSSWLIFQEYPKVNASKLQSKIAIHHIGTNAFPVLIGWLASRTEGPLKIKLIQFLEAHPKIPFHLQRASEKRFKAARTFQILGPMGKPAVPALIKLFTHVDDEGIQVEVLMSLIAIGPSAREASPVLIDYIHNFQGSSRFGDSMRDLVEHCLETIDPEAAAKEEVK
jgi:hypothetical protein